MNINIDNLSLVIIIFFLAVNLLAFFIMLLDKTKAQIKDAERISEGMLFFMATAFGSLGVYAGMFAFHHKTRKWYFRIGIPMLIIENCAFLFLVYLFLSSSNLLPQIMYYLYILKCADKTLYTGITTNLERRLSEHNGSKLGARYTSARRPVKIVYSRKFKSRSTASKEEARIKKLKKLEKLELIKKFKK